MVRDIANKKGGAPEARRRPDREDQINMLNISHGEESGKPNGSLVPKAVFVADTNFKKKLRWKIENPAQESEVWRITPKMAEAMLEWNDRNRPLKTGAVARYAKQMSNGRWRYTGVPIIFSRKRLIDGQNRLHAVIESGCTIDAMVVFGVPDDSFAFIDIGAKRSASDVFAINGVKNHAAMAAASQWLMGYEAGLFGDAAKATVGADGEALHDFYSRHFGLQDSMWVVSLFGKVQLFSPSILCAIHYLCAKKSRAQADEFFRKVGDGLGFTGKRDPAYKLHKALIDAAVSGNRFGRKAGAAIVIKAWNATRLNRDVGSLNFGADETFPKVI